MVDTFHPLSLTKEAADLEDPAYPYSWLPPEDAGETATQLASAARRHSPTDSARLNVCRRRTTHSG